MFQLVVICFRKSNVFLQINFIFVLLGVIEALCKYYQNENKDVRRVWLSAGVDHFHSSLGDKGWGCGYRNFQMLLSSLLQNSLYNDCLRGINQNPDYLFCTSSMTTYWSVFYFFIYARLTSGIPIGIPIFIPFNRIKCFL